MITEKIEQKDRTLLSTGIEGLDEVLRGGLPVDRLYLIEGDPGAGKTTLALQFLLDGVKHGQPCMLVTLSESKEELRDSAASHGWSLDGVTIVELAAPDEGLTENARYTMYHPSEVELGETTKAILAEAARVKPARVVFDSLSEFRLLAENPLRYRRQILALKQYFSRQHCTVLFIDDKTHGVEDMHLHSIAHGVVSLTRQSAEYGTLRRRLQVGKLRGRAFREGFHDFAIQRGGLQVFPRLVAAEHREGHARESVESGLKSLDTLLGGGLARGTSTLVIGAAGTGKSTLATQYARAAAARGERAVLFLFDEAIATFLARSAGLGIDVEPLVRSGNLTLRQVDPAELSPGEFAHTVRRAAEEEGNRLVMIDSLNGYLNAMPSERFLVLHLHELLTYLGQKGVTTLLLMTQHGLVVADGQVPLDTSYLADTVILLRYFEALGEVRQAISVIKKRTGKHERTIREMRLDNGIKIGDPIREFQGVLTGVPQFVGHKGGNKEP